MSPKALFDPIKYDVLTTLFSGEKVKYFYFKPVNLIMNRQMTRGSMMLTEFTGEALM